MCIYSFYCTVDQYNFKYVLNKMLCNKFNYLIALRQLFRQYLKQLQLGIYTFGLVK